MSRVTDAQLEAARGLSIAEIAERLALEGLHKSGAERVGPCPACGGTDRFALNVAKDVWLCRHCTPDGGDGIALVRLVLSCDLPAAIAWLVGSAEVELSPEVAERRARERAQAKREREEEAARRRAEAVAMAREMWAAGKPAKGSAVADYLACRGLASMAAAPPPCLRFAPSLPYLVGQGRDARTIHEGPVMLAAIAQPDGSLGAIHRTWLDLSRPKGKARIVDPTIRDPDRQVLSAKKSWGHKKAGAIRLTHPNARGFDTLVMGEGIETTATALEAGTFQAAAHWAGVDLTNMAGRRITRRKGMLYRGIPDLDGEDVDGFLPPPWVRWLVFIQDGDSEPRLTRAQLMAGLRRARARNPMLERISIVHAGEGRDLNDIVMEGAA
ncbi:primase-helicase zinc-binding domain-containing protein [Pseudoroseicyclus sp. CXY001]|uniref:DUF7146 domain-containing protein n=1 Tax=Pseudoroseicyclus sp. CXY001 TaxID=3242492 RepID=UPI0035713A8B